LIKPQIDAPRQAAKEGIKTQKPITKWSAVTAPQSEEETAALAIFFSEGQIGKNQRHRKRQGE
jgi:hypothetical protein